MNNIIKHNIENNYHLVEEKFKNLNIKKILLIQPPDSDKKIFNFKSAKRGRLWNYPPYGLGVLAKRLQNENIEVQILNLNNEILKFIHNNQITEDEFDFDKVWIDSLNETLNNYEPCFVGLTSMFSQSHEITKQISEYINSYNDKIVIGAGGVHITNSLVDDKTFDKFVKDIRSVDFFFTYEADLSFLEFVRCVNNKSDYEKLGQIVIRIKENEFIFINKKLHPGCNDLDTIPALELMEVGELSKYGTIGSFFCHTKPSTKISTVISNRGCRAQCTFCSVRNFNGVGVRRRSVESVIEELKRLRFEHDIRHIMWLDDDFLYNPKESINLFNSIAKENLDLTWDCSNGVIAAACKEEVIDAAEKSGCIGVNIGMESGNREILKSVRKPGTVENFLKAAEVFRKFEKINARVFLMIGFPKESYQMILDTIEVSKQMSLDWYNVSILEPLPNTPIFESMVQEGQIDLENLEFSEIRYNSGGLGKHKQQKRDMLSSEFNKAFSVTDLNEIPPKEKLDDIWAYMNYHLNFKRLVKKHSQEKIIQKKQYVANITDLISPENCLALYFQAYLEKKLDGKAKLKTINNLKSRIKQFPYWKNRFNEFNLSIDDVSMDSITVDSIEKKLAVN
tara:strand:- start:1786 stop:3651 length:1866 start_codon:yes stop_codon:yes gene_type:complete